MKQFEKAAVQDFIEQRRTKIEHDYELAKDAALQRAELEAKTWLAVHRYEMLQGAPLMVLQKFQEKVRCGYELVGPHDRFWPEATPGFLSIPLIVPQKRLQKHADEVKQRTLGEQMAIAEANYRSALSGLEAEALDFLIAHRAKAAEQADINSVRALLDGD